MCSWTDKREEALTCPKPGQHMSRKTPEGKRDYVLCGGRASEQYGRGGLARIVVKFSGSHHPNSTIP